MSYLFNDKLHPKSPDGRVCGRCGSLNTAMDHGWRSVHYLQHTYIGNMYVQHIRAMVAPTLTCNACGGISWTTRRV